MRPGLGAQTALNLAGGAANAFLNFLVAVVVARTLGAGGSAEFFEAVAIFSILSVLGAAGSGPGLIWAISGSLATGRVREVAHYLRVALLGVAATGFVAALALFLGAPVIARHLQTGQPPGDLQTTLRTLALFLPLACLGASIIAATRAFRTVFAAVVIDGFGKNGLRVVLLLAVLSRSRDMTSVSLAWAAPIAIGLVAATAWLAALLRRAVSSDSDDRPVAPGISRRFWSFSAFQLANDGFQVTLQWIDILLLGLLSTAIQTGIYSAVGRISFLGLLALVAAGQALAPQVSRLHATSQTEPLQRLFATSTALLCAVSTPIFLLLAAFPRPLLALFGAGFVTGGAALTIISLGMIANVATGVVGVVLLMGGRSGLSMTNSCAALGANLALNWLLIPPYGMVGAAAAWAVSIVVLNITAVIQVWRIWGLHPFSTAYWLTAVAAVGTYGVIPLVLRALYGQAPLTLATAVAIATPIYAGLLWRPISLALRQA